MSKVKKSRWSMDPSRNNMPLQFNTNKNKPPMPVVRTDGKDLDVSDDVSSSTSQSGMMPTDGSTPGQNSGNMMNMFGMMGNMVGPMAGDPNMMMMGPMMGPMGGFGGMMGPGPNPMMGAPLVGPMGPMGPNMAPNMGPNMMGGPMPVVREVIRLKNCVLYPPPVNAPPRSTRDRPPGCRTIFIGGIPENCTEALLFEVFESCGPIESIRISKKNFAHVRFANMDSVDRSLFISGYRMKINDSDDKEDTGRIHVDYAQARDDQYEFECQQRAMAREMRHLQRMEEERLRPPSPPPITHYSDHEASLLSEKIKSDDNFTSGSQVLVTWLERGECNKRTANHFYSMIQNVHTHLRRLNTEKQTLIEEYEAYKIQYQQRTQGINKQMSQVERVMAAAHKQKAWDHFTKAQRKNIDTWQRQAQEDREASDNKSEKSDMDDDMDMSDEEGGSTAKKRKFGSESADTTKLKEENDALKCQMEAFKNEVDIIRSEGKQDVEEREKQIKALQNALQGMQQQLISQRTLVSKQEEELARLKESELEAEKDKEMREKEREREKREKEEKEKEEAEKKSYSESRMTKAYETVSSSGLSLTEKEVQIIGLVCVFLHVHPHGATVDYLWSYLRQIVNVRVREVEDLLEKVPSIMQQEIHGVGAAIERRWVFTGLKSARKSGPD